MKEGCVHGRSLTKEEISRARPSTLVFSAGVLLGLEKACATEVPQAGASLAMWHG